MREKDEPTEEQLREFTNPTSMEGEDHVMPPKPAGATNVDIPEGRAKVQSETGWPCIWEGYSRRFITAHPEHPWLRIVGRTPEIMIERVNLVKTGLSKNPKVREVTPPTPVPLPAPTKAPTKAPRAESAGTKSKASVSAARDQGYTGDTCSNPECGSMKVVRNGACLLCRACGQTTGCS
jgi:hypothetical protein